MELSDVKVAAIKTYLAMFNKVSQNHPLCHLLFMGGIRFTVLRPTFPFENWHFFENFLLSFEKWM